MSQGADKSHVTHSKRRRVPLIIPFLSFHRNKIKYRYSSAAEIEASIRVFGKTLECAYHPPCQLKSELVNSLDIIALRNLLNLYRKLLKEWLTSPQHPKHPAAVQFLDHIVHLLQKVWVTPSYYLTKEGVTKRHTHFLRRRKIHGVNPKTEGSRKKILELLGSGFFPYMVSGEVRSLPLRSRRRSRRLRPPRSL